MNKERLTKFVEFLRTRVPDDHFNFGVYMETKESGTTPSLTTCGSVGCAVGWLPAFDPEAFRWEVGPRDYGVPDVLLRAEDELRDIYAAAHYFDLTDHEATFLFMPYGNNGLSNTSSVAAVARNMERFIEHGLP